MTSAALHPETLAQAPELATLALLETLLVVTTRVLLAQHPALISDEHPPYRAEPRTLRDARYVLRRLHPLRDAIVSYRVSVLDALAPVDIDDSDIPF